MKTIIAGSRDLEIFKDKERVWVVADAIMKSGWRNEITEIVSGGARGIDHAGICWALSVSPQIPVKPFMPLWDKYGKGAGFIRNRDMAAYADALIIVWNGTSRGSSNMLQEAKKKNLKIYEYIVK